MRRTLASLLLLVMTSCVSEEQWSFSMTRAVYDSEESFETFAPAEDLADSPEGALVLVAIMLLPVALDIVLLPVTVPRDLIVFVGS